MDEFNNNLTPNESLHEEFKEQSIAETPIEPANTSESPVQVSEPSTAPSPSIVQDNSSSFGAPSSYSPTQSYNNQNPYANAVNFNTPINTNITGAVPPTAKKTNKNTGKYIFVGLVCVFVIVASVIVGISLNSDNKPSDNGKNNVASQQAADIKTEDSPVSYSEYSGKGPMTAEQVYQEVKDINVGILVYSLNQKAGEGSGIIVGESKDKNYTYILTAAHVISGEGVSVQVQFNDESEIAATVVGLDEKTDLGVLKIKKSGLKTATFGNSSKLSVGQTVYAIGNPGGTEFFGSFTSGTISAIDRPVPTTNSSYDLPCIQHNAAINPGNSGGALVNEYGQVIGLNSSKISSTEYEGMGFSVPSETMIEVYNEIIKNGYVSNRPMLGITYYAVSSDYQTLNVASKNGLPYGSVVIATLSNSSDLVNHGVKAGDIITAVNGKKMDSTDVLLEVIENAKVGDKITLTICRIGSNGTIETTFDARVELVEDTGDNAAPQPTQEPTTEDPYSRYFEDFGY